MDEAIWAVIGIIGLIIGVGAIGSLISSSNGELSFSQVENSLKLMNAQCNQVCSLPENTANSLRVKLPSETIITTQSDTLCAARGDNIFCERCDCIYDTSDAVLNLSDADAFFSSHQFTCRFIKADTRNTAQIVRLECAG